MSLDLAFLFLVILIAFWTITRASRPRVHRLDVADPWFSYIRDDLKTIEGRLRRGRFATMKVGDVLEIGLAGQPGRATVRRRIIHVLYRSTFADLLEEQGSKVLPGVPTVAAGVTIYRQFYSAEDEEAYGVAGFFLGPV